MYPAPTCGPDCSYWTLVDKDTRTGTCNILPGSRMEDDICGLCYRGECPDPALEERDYDQPPPKKAD
jgi:hypothetical protein